MTDKKRTPSVFWWTSAEETFGKVIREYLKKAKAAEIEEQGHDCGHEWTITVQCRGHYRMADDLVTPEHSDAKYFSTYKPVVVRAHNLQDALLLAVAEPLQSWFPTRVDDDHEVVMVNEVAEEVLKEEEEGIDPETQELLDTIDRNGVNLTEHGL